MAQQLINVGTTANDGTGDTWRDAFIKVNANDTELFDNTFFTKRVLVNSTADLPTPAGGIITLAANTQYLLANDVNIGTDRFVLLDGSAIAGIESILITLTYTGSGDLFTMTDVTARVSNLRISAATGRLFNWSETTGKIFRSNDVSVVSCNKIGLFTSTAGVCRFTNFSPASVTTDGCQLVGNFRSFLWEVSAAVITAGSMFNLGTATFDSIIINNVLGTLNGTSNLVSGATGSANINAGGQGILLTNLTSGTGTPLSGITSTDALWKMAHNDDIPDTNRSATGYVIGNATATSIAVASTPVKVDFGTSWIADKQDQWVSDTSGTHTYSGPPQTFHITGSVSAQNVTGNAKVFRWYVAKNGVIILSSVSQREYSSALAGAIALTGLIDVVATDFLEIWVENITDTTNITAQTVNLVIEG